jgi:hypothetical protein
LTPEFSLIRWLLGQGTGDSFRKRLSLPRFRFSFLICQAGVVPETDDHAGLTAKKLASSKQPLPNELKLLF